MGCFQDWKLGGRGYGGRGGYGINTRHQGLFSNEQGANVGGAWLFTRRGSGGYVAVWRWRRGEVVVLFGSRMKKPRGCFDRATESQKVVHVVVVPRQNKITKVGWGVGCVRRARGWRQFDGGVVASLRCIRAVFGPWFTAFCKNKEVEGCFGMFGQQTTRVDGGWLSV